MSTLDLHRPITHSELLVNSLRRFPDREAFRQDGVGWTYRETEARLARFVRVLRESGLGRGQGIGVLSPNRPEVWLSQAGAGLAGGRYTALHPMGSSGITNTPATKRSCASCSWTPTMRSARARCSRRARPSRRS